MPEPEWGRAASLRLSFNVECEVENPVDWFLEKVAYAHLDEIPDFCIKAAIIKQQVLFLATAVCIAANEVEHRDDPQQIYEYMKAMNPQRLEPAYRLFHGWMLIEALRRQGHTVIPEDMLVRECVHKQILGIKDKTAKPFRGIIGLTATGEVVLRAN